MAIVSNKVIDVGIIGGGVGGLSLAYFISNQNQPSKALSFKIFEKSNRLGGIIQTEQTNDFTFEHGPDSFLQKDSQLDPFFQDLKLSSRLVSTIASHRRSLIVSEEKLIGIPQGFYLCAPTQTLSFLRSPLLSPAGKLRTLMEPFVPPKKTDEDESMEEFILRRFGKENYQRISQAMLGGIFTGDPSELSIQSCIPRLYNMEKQYGSVIRGLKKEGKDSQSQGPRYQLFRTFKRGMQELTITLERKIPNSAIHVYSSIKSIRKDQSRWVIEDESGNVHRCKHLCLCVPSHVSANMLSHLDPELSKSLASIPYSSSAIVNIGFAMKKNLPSAMGFVVPRTEKMNILACGFLSQKFPNRAPKGKHIIRVFLGGSFQKHFLELSNDQILDLAIKDIEKLFRTRIKVEVSSVAKWTKSLPQYVIGHQENIRSISGLLQKHENLFLGSNAYDGVGIPDTILRSKAIAEKIQKVVSLPTAPEIVS
ncbi:MAG: protoporphyrinogen oxidase [Bdellovibrionota bacterium]